MKKLTSLMLATLLLVSVLPFSVWGSDAEYIPAPHTLDPESEGPLEYLAPVFYENEDGPKIGVTLVGVIKQDGKYFKDSNNNQELDPYEDWRLDSQERVADLVSRLTPQQRIGLLANQLIANPGVDKGEEAYDEDGNVIFNKLVTPISQEVDLNAELSEDEKKDVFAMYRKAVKKPMASSVILTHQNRTGVLRKDTDLELGALFNNALQLTAEFSAMRSGDVNIPYILISNPMNAGYPKSQGMAAAVMGDGNYELIARHSKIDAAMWNAKGIRQMYGPQIDLITDPRWGRNPQTYTEVPEVMSGIAAALVEGYQHGTDGIQRGDIALQMKHFPGDSPSENGWESHYASGQFRLYPTEGSLETYHLPAFQAAIDAGLRGIMPSYSRVPKDARSVLQSYRGVEITPEELGSGFNRTILETLLKDTMGFDGFINSDSNIISIQHWGTDEQSKPERFATAINAGCDVVGDGMFGIDYESITEAVETGLVTEEALDRASSNRMRTAIDQGLFEDPYTDPVEGRANNDALAEEKHALMKELNQKSVVLMKNSNETLPLQDSSKKLYYANFTDKGPDEKAEEAFKAAFEAAGYTLVDKADEADIAFLDVVPGGATIREKHLIVLDLVDELEVDERNYPDNQERTGETIEISTLQDVKKIKRIAEKVHANGGVVIGSIDISAPWILTNLEPHVDALIGQFSTNAEARVDIVTGKASPTGKLPQTMVASAEVIAVVETEIDGKTYEVCVSPNDVPGYDKDQYMSKEVLEQSPSGSYAYQDSDGNVYRAWHGLGY